MAKRMEKLALACAQCAQALGEELGAMDMQVSESKKAIIFFLELRLSIRICTIIAAMTSTPAMIQMTEP